MKRFRLVPGPRGASELLPRFSFTEKARNFLEQQLRNARASPNELWGAKRAGVFGWGGEVLETASP